MKRNFIRTETLKNVREQCMGVFLSFNHMTPDLINTRTKNPPSEFPGFSFQTCSTTLLVSEFVLRPGDMWRVNSSKKKLN